MAGAIMLIGLTPESESVLARWRDAPQRVEAALSAGLREGLVAIENHMKLNMFAGGPQSGGEMPIGIRSGSLRQAITHELDERHSGTFGAGSPAQAYARVQLGPDDTVMRPKNANHLWIPIADNVTPSGQTRMSPRAAMEQTDDRGRRRLRIFRSRAGNLVAFLPDPRGGRVQRGERKGQMRGRLLFVLKEEVTIEGRDALGEAWRQMQDAFERILNRRLAAAISDEGGADG